MKKKTSASGNARSTGRAVRHSTARVEALEPRLLMSSGLCVLDIAADNRGQIVLRFNESVDASTFNTTSVTVFTAGSDNLFNTSDDVRQTIGVSLDSTTRQTGTIAANLAPNTRYKVTLDSSIIRSLTGRRLDGEFNGAGEPTGDGVEGGDLLFYTSRAASQVARFDTPFGVINVNLFADRTPLSVNNFAAYADSARYDNTIVHRAIALPTPFIIQGGGYNNVPGFAHVQADPAIRNEPGVRNTRGTIAFAKLPNQPNSATTEWFFNLSDNADLNTQNGGFTVFGEIADEEGLRVMDRIADLRVIDARSVNSAFQNLPVTNGTVTPSTLTTADTALVRRISILMDLSGAPAGQLDAPGFTVTAASGAFVTLYDMTGGTLGDLSNAFTVKFDGDRVSSVKLNANAPSAGIGLAIGAARSVGSITDARAAGDLDFIVSSGPVGSMRVNGTLRGADLGGLIVGSVTFDRDIDGDGLTDDLLAVWMPKGLATDVVVRGGLTGDFLAMGGVRGMRIDGLVSGVDIEIGDSGPTYRGVDLRFGRIADSDIRSETWINQFRTAEWVDRTGDSDALTAPYIGFLRVSGDRAAGLAGDFEADVNVSGAGLPYGLGEMTIAGAFRNAVVDVAGSVRTVNFKGGGGNANFFTTGDFGALQAGVMSNFGLSVGGEMRSIRAAQWHGGELIADGVRRIDIVGDRRTGAKGDFAVRMTLSGLGNVRPVFHAINVAGNISSTDWQVNGVGGGVVNIKGDILDGRMRFQRDIKSFRAGAVSSLELRTTNGHLRDVQVESWRGGLIETSELNSLRVTGDRLTGDVGDFVANITAQGVHRMRVAGSVYDSLVSTSSISFGTLQLLDVKGTITNSEFRIRGDVGTVTTAGMINSQFYAAVRPGVSGLPGRDDVDFFRSIQRFTITQPADAPFGFVSSFIVSGKIGEMRLGEVQPQNYGTPFGVAAETIDQLRYTSDGSLTWFSSLRSDPTPTPFLDFQVRINYAAPADA